MVKGMRVITGTTWSLTVRENPGDAVLKSGKMDDAMNRQDK
jgi:hypothetical protein